MLFMLFCLAVVIISWIAFRMFHIRHPFSKGVAIAAALSMLSTICLAQNYTESLVPGGQDGIAVSNRIAYWIIGEDLWSVQLFRVYFESSIYITLMLIVLYPVVLVLETRLSSGVRKLEGRDVRDDAGPVLNPERQL
jgi:hypothetical protein